MTHPLYDASVPTFLMFLKALSRLIDKAQASGIPEEQIMASRLAPDMHPFPRQIQIATDVAKGAIGRLTQQTPPVFADDETTLDQLKARIARAMEFIGSARPEQFEGAESRAIEMKASGRDLRFDGTSYLLRFATPNFFFHVTTAYGLLRKEGVPLGKPDFFGAE